QGRLAHIELTSADLGLACVVVRLCRTQTLLGLGVGPMTGLHGRERSIAVGLGLSQLIDRRSVLESLGEPRQIPGRALSGQPWGPWILSVCVIDHVGRPLLVHVS